MSTASSLYRLQLIDNTIDSSNERKRTLEIEINDWSQVDQVESVLKVKKDLLLNEQKKLKKIEEDVEIHNKKMQEAETALYGGKTRNPKELMDYQKDALALKKYLTVLEDQELEVMLSLDLVEQEYQTVIDQLNSIKIQQQDHKNRLKLELEEILSIIARAETERISAASLIPQADHSLYEQLRKQRKGLAVTTISDHYCSACGSTFTPALMQASHHPTQLLRCPSCNRIIYPG